MGYTPETVKDLIKLGGSIKVSGSYTPGTLKDFAQLAKENNVQLTIKVNSLTPGTLKELIKIAKDNVILEL